jgi:hypothetical protein
LIARITTHTGVIDKNGIRILTTQPRLYQPGFVVLDWSEKMPSREIDNCFEEVKSAWVEH